MLFRVALAILYRSRPIRETSKPLVAELGFEPRYVAYETTELPLLYSALKRPNPLTPPKFPVVNLTSFPSIQLSMFTIMDCLKSIPQSYHLNCHSSKLQATCRPKYHRTQFLTQCQCILCRSRSNSEISYQSCP